MEKNETLGAYRARLESATSSSMTEGMRGAILNGAFNSMHEAHSVIREEFEEFWEEVRRDDQEAAVKECTQLAAMALRFIAEYS